MLTEFVENILSKDTSFSNRTDLWFASIQQIIQSPWIGYGPQSIDWMVSHIGGSGPHNLLLMILLQGGLLLLSIFVGIVFSVFRVLYKQNSPVANFVAVAVCVLLLMSLFETYNIGGHNEKQNIEIIHIILDTLQEMLPEGDPRKELVSENLITYVTDRKGHDRRYAIAPDKIKAEVGWYPETCFAEGIKKTIKWFFENEEWMKNVTSGDYQKYYQEMYK